MTYLSSLKLQAFEHHRQERLVAANGACSQWRNGQGWGQLMVISTVMPTFMVLAVPNVFPVENEK